jgi:chromosome segregation ATPase
VSTCKDFEDKNKSFYQQLEEKETLIREYEQKASSFSGMPLEMEDSLIELKEKYDEIAKKLEEALAKLREREEKIKVMTGQFKKEKALLEQTLNFNEIQVSDLKRQLEENKRLNENALSALEGRGEKRTVNRDMDELSAAFESKRTRRAGSS